MKLRIILPLFFIVGLIISGCVKDEVIKEQSNVNNLGEFTTAITFKAQDEYEKTVNLREIYNEIDKRNNLDLVADEKNCEQEDIYCFDYNDLIVKVNFDETQQKFYELMKDYELPKEGAYEKDGYSNHVFYENGYVFYKDTKMLYAAPGHSIDEVKPNEDQYFGIVMMWIELYGYNSPGEITNQEEALSKLEGLKHIDEFAQNDIVLSWINNCTLTLQKIINEKKPSEELYLEAWKKLNHLGLVVKVFRFEERVIN